MHPTSPGLARAATRTAQPIARNAELLQSRFISSSGNCCNEFLCQSTLDGMLLTARQSWIVQLELEFELTVVPAN